MIGVLDTLAKTVTCTSPNIGVAGSAIVEVALFASDFVAAASPFQLRFNPSLTSLQFSSVFSVAKAKIVAFVDLTAFSEVCILVFCFAVFWFVILCYVKFC